MKSYASFASGIVLLAFSVPASTCNPETGERLQMVYLESDGKTVEYWEMVPDDIKVVQLSGGEKIGVAISPAGPEKYIQKTSSGRFTPELVQIRVFDMNGVTPVETHMSWGGANSVQGFSGFTLNLLKPVCHAPELKNAMAQGGNS